MIVKIPLQTCKAYWIVPPVREIDSCNMIINKGCEFFNISRKVLLSPKRDRFLVMHRFMIMHSLLHNYRIKAGVTHIGRLFNRNHSTIVKGMQTFDNILATDEFCRKELQRLHEHIYGHLDYYKIKGIISAPKKLSENTQ